MATHEFDGYDKMVHGWAQAAARENLPRQAYVVRPDGMGAVVQFNDGSHAIVPSTHAGLPVGTRGWVLPTHGGKGLFVATGVSVPQTDQNYGSASLTISTTGTYRVSEVSVTFTDLNPTRTYQVEGYVGIRTGGTSLRQYRPTIEAQGDTAVSAHAVNHHSDTDNHFHKNLVKVDVRPSADGEITVYPAVTYNSGTVNVTAASIYATVS